MAATDGTQTLNPSKFRHSKYEWGEVFSGTKEELQAAGFGVGLSFPGEAGANKTKFTIAGVKGFAKASIRKVFDYGTDIERRVHTGLFDVQADYLQGPKWSFYRKNPSVFAPGVKRHEDVRCDVYVGTGPALVACGLITTAQLPGSPNCGKVRTTFLPDGSRVAKGGSGASHLEGSKCVRQNGKVIAVEIMISESAGEARHSDYLRCVKADELVWKEALARRHALTNTPKRRDHLRLVWSA